MRTIRYLFAMVLAIALVACGDDPVDNSGQVWITARDTAGGSVGGVGVQLKSGTRVVQQGVTDANGELKFLSLPGGDYALALTVPLGYNLGTAQANPATFTLISGRIKTMGLIVNAKSTTKPGGGNTES